ncbi:hypothetical protein [Niabella aurantiaca]|uniref:hypothetical protein n=1 Tax=Niabella aurantiaca TaxID=379900 RepID=UPI0003809E08|nr:hypothetical protein [Niabella aurantiaca]
MKKTLLIPVTAVVAAVTMFAACVKNDGPSCVPYTLEQDKHIIDSFINANSLESVITYSAESSWYEGTMDPGAGSMPKADSIISFKYSISLMDGTVIFASDTIKQNDDGSPIKLSNIKDPLNSVFAELQKGGKYRYIYPSSVYFSCAPQTINGKTVPGSSELIYDYTLTEVKAPAAN